jgi:hypothetical protein
MDRKVENMAINERLCCHFNSTKDMDISIAFAILKPLEQRFSSNISAFVFGYGGLRTFV